MADDRRQLLDTLQQSLESLSPARLRVISNIVRAFAAELDLWVNDDSDFADDAFARTLGDTLLVHHVMSREAFTKDKFEHAMEAALNATGHQAALAARGNPGHDITVDDERWSLKTQADGGIGADRIHISKFMELGKGAWATEADLAGLRARMFAHMENYDRILTLRCLTARRSRLHEPQYEYELVEIPTELLRRAAGERCVMLHDSTQTPKPGTCTVTEDGEVLFQIYFDGGTERKLQVRHLAVSSCRRHASWRFPREPLPA